MKVSVFEDKVVDVVIDNVALFRNKMFFYFSFIQFILSMIQISAPIGSTFSENYDRPSNRWT